MTGMTSMWIAGNRGFAAAGGRPTGWVFGARLVLCVAAVACGADAEGSATRRSRTTGSSGVAGMGASTGDATGAIPGNPVQPPGMTGSDLPVPPQGGADDVCGSEPFAAETTTETIEVPGNVLFLFDRSLTMGDPWGGRPKWQVATEAVVNAIQPIETQVNAGAIVYPSAACSLAPYPGPPHMAMSPGSQFIAAWQKFWSTELPVFGTPAGQALKAALDWLTASPPPGTTAIVLVSDGDFFCSDGLHAIYTKALADIGVKTHVIGLPGAFGVPALTEVASLGGTAPYTTPEDLTTLQKQLGDIATTTITTVTTITNCEFALSAPADADPAQVHLVVTEASTGNRYEVPVGAAWTLSADNSTGTLVGTTCDEAKNGRFASFEFQYGCVDEPILPPT